jgi:hypothetical protein
MEMRERREECQKLNEKRGRERKREEDDVHQLVKQERAHQISKQQRSPNSSVE